MKRFVFRLARLERLREIARKEARVAVADAMAEVQARRRRKTVLEESCTEAMAARLEGDLAHDPHSMKALQAWREGRQRSLEAGENRLAEAVELAGDALHRHTEAARAHRVLERLRTRRHDQWKHEAEREETKFLDEIHQQRLARRRG